MRIILCIITSGLLLLSFYISPYFIFFSFIPLFFVCYNSKKSFIYGFVSGFIFSIGLLYWISVLEVPVRLWLYLGLLLLFIYFGLIFGLSMWFTYKVRAFFLIPIVWVSIEFIRSLSPELGFPWGSVGTALIPKVKLVQLAEFVGLHGISLIVMIINTLLFYFIKKKKIIYIIFAFLIIFLMHFYGNFAINKHTGGKKIRVVIVQPNFSHELKRGGNFDERLQILYKLSKNTNADLIIWPESALPGYLNLTQSKEIVSSIIDSINVPVIMGGGRLEFSPAESKIYNSSFLFLPGNGLVDYYDKIYLVPFGEKLPFDEIFPVLQRLNFGQGNFTPGKEYKVFEVNGIKFSTLICFESIFPRISRKFVRNGAQLLVNITDDSWFGRTAGPYQHAYQSILRAIEYRTPIARCGNTGVSFFVDKKGYVHNKTEIFTQKVIVNEVELRDGLTFYAKFGDILCWFCVGIFFLLFNLRFRQ